MRNITLCLLMNPPPLGRSPHIHHTLYIVHAQQCNILWWCHQQMCTKQNRLQWGHLQWTHLQHKDDLNKCTSNINTPQTNAPPANMLPTNAPPTNLPPLLSPLLVLTLGMNLLALTPCMILLVLVLNFSAKITFIFSKRWIFTPQLHVFCSTQWSIVPSSLLHLSEFTMN